MSDTPRKDSVENSADWECGEIGRMRDLARELECELADANAEVESLKDKIAELCGADNYLLATQLERVTKELDAAKAVVNAADRVNAYYEVSDRELDDAMESLNDALREWDDYKHKVRPTSR